MVFVIQFKKSWSPRPEHGEVWRALYASLSKASGFPKMVIAVDEDIDPHDPESVLWALSFRHQPHRDTKIVEGRTSALDPSAAPPETSTVDRRFPASVTGPRGCSAMLIDATRKWPYVPVALPDKQ